MRVCQYVICLVLAAGIFSGCTGPSGEDYGSSCEYASYFDIPDSASVVTISPYDGHRDTLRIDGPMDNIICMSSSHVAALAAIDADSLISAVSGIRYLTDKRLRDRFDGVCGRPLYDIGYENSLSYETVLSLKPDLLVAYTVSGSEPQYLVKLRSLGIPVLVIHDHLEEHPLARAEYVRLFGVLAGRRHIADSVFNEVRNRYEQVRRSVGACVTGKKVLLNIPYGDAWYVPGQDSYMARLISDAGGEVLGSVAGSSRSGVISTEQAYLLSKDADIWLNPGYCSSRVELSSVHQLFPSFGPLAKGLPIYNNTLRTTPEGGNDFWESGVMRPDLILSDLMTIFGSADVTSEQDLHYFFPLE